MYIHTPDMAVERCSPYRGRLLERRYISFQCTSTRGLQQQGMYDCHRCSCVVFVHVPLRGLHLAVVHTIIHSLMMFLYAATKRQL